MIRITRGLSVFALAAALSACGGGASSFEGEWKPQATGATAQLEMTRQMVEGNGTMKIGSDYLMIKGNKVPVQSKEITEQGGNNYLSFTLANGQTHALEIVDDDTLKDSGVIFRRI